MQTKSGFVGIIGRSNVGKSTFLNLVIGKKIAITSHKVQTTRDRILGIHTKDNTQIIFVDTPGVHKKRHLLDERMDKISFKSQRGVDFILFFTTPSDEIFYGDTHILDKIMTYNIPVILVINKIDINKKSVTENTFNNLTNKYNFINTFFISAKDGVGIDILIKYLEEKMPISPFLYDMQYISDKTDRFNVQELIREKILLLTNEEVPHSVCVVIDSFKENQENNYTDIYASIICERESQKRIIVGHLGQMIKKIKELSIKDIKKYLGTKVHLDLFVKVKKDWRSSNLYLNNLGYKEEEF